MKKILTNKKGFTLIELLAVIVVLAIIMVIATQQVNKTVSGSRANAFVESYQMLVKQVKTFIAQDETPTCGGTGEDVCLTKYDLSDDYQLTVTKNESSSSYTITLTGAQGKFKNLDIGKYGNYNKSESDTTKCDISKIASGATGCSKNSITGKVDY